MTSIVITDSDFDTKVLKSGQTVLVDFWAPWCGPCKMSEPVLEEIAKEQDKVTIAKMNVDENQQTPPKYGVMSIPTMILFKNGQETGRQVGFSGKKAIEDLITKA